MLSIEVGVVLDRQGKQEEPIYLLVETHQRIATALEGICLALTKGLGEGHHLGYPDHDCLSELVDEKTMAEMLTIPRRTLAYHRDQGRLPGCWVKNGRRILWHVGATKEAWKMGIG